ncbi:dienelactone hydrolase family protein [uncultured Jatrophihabitans sp.]|uniref:dienelactone hydrolase family protein n=1 Tax=uncultured Jatrophihabitans sp. TaxID=1610747 RepID=UPI0035C98906
MPEITIDSPRAGSQVLRGYLARPAGAGPFPGVVVIHELFGDTAEMRRQADRLAAAGYLAVLPDLFSDGGARRCLIATFRAMFAGRGKAIDDIDAAQDYTREHPDCTGKVGIIGFCMGGGFALVTANHGFDVSAANYGQPPRNAEAALAGACPIVASYGGKDVSLRGAAQKVERTLTDLGVDHDVKEYPTAGHSFLNEEYFGPAPTHALQRIAHVGPDPQAAPDAWRRIEEFLARYLTA